jgi:hypothetical protein
MAANANATAAPPTANIGPRVIIAAPAVEDDVDADADDDDADADVDFAEAVACTVLDPSAKYIVPEAALVALAMSDEASLADSVTTAWP